MKQSERTGSECPECLTPHAVIANGAWRCNNGLVDLLANRLICGARGTVMPDGSLAVLRGGAHPMQRSESGELQIREVLA